MNASLILRNCMVLLLLVVTSQHVKAKYATAKKRKQYKNSFIVSTSRVHFPGYAPFLKYKLPFESTYFPAKQYGISYSRVLKQNISITAAYETWNQFPFVRMRYSGPGIVINTQEGNVVGEGLLLRTDHRMVDVLISYQFNKFRRDKIKAGIGPSFTAGYNSYIDEDTIPMDHFHWQWDRYYGVVSNIGYDHLFFKNRIAAGAQVACRKYFGLELLQFNIGLHAGVNF